MDATLAIRRGPPPLAVALGAVALIASLLGAHFLSSQADPLAGGGIRASVAELPLSFEPNAGRTDRRVDYLSHSVAGGSLYLTGSEAVLALSGRGGESDSLRLGFPGAAPGPEVRGLERLPGEVSSFIGDDPSRWRSGVPTYSGVRYENLYPGIDLDFYGNQRDLEFDFRLAAHADPSRIAIELGGADSLRLTANGDLLIALGKHEIRQRTPVAYQTINGERVPVDSAYELRGSTVGFSLGPYDRSRPLVIDPVLVYSTHVGGSGNDLGFGIAVDSAGAAYITGSTTSSDFPTVGALQTDQPGTDAFVSKLNPAGTALVYSTYLGGDSPSLDEGFGIAVDSAGSAYVAGRTNSTDFPTEDEFQPDQGSIDAFVTKLTPSGGGLEYSTYLGGASIDEGAGIAVDSAGAAYVTGNTISTDFPLQKEAQTDKPSTDAFVTKLDPDPGGAGAVTLAYSTYLGGDDTDRGNGIALDSADAAYVVGETFSTDFATVGAFQADQPGRDAFAAKLDPDPGGVDPVTLAYSTYLGGSGDFDHGRAIAVDSAGAAYLTGQTNSTDFPTLGAIQGNLPDDDVFATKLNPAGSALVYSTYLGGTAKDWGFGIAVDSAGAAHVTGVTGSADFATVDPLQADAAGDDFFVTKLNPAGSALTYSTYLGGNGTDFGRGIALDSAGNAYVTGFTNSTDFFGAARSRTDLLDKAPIVEISGQASATPCVITVAEKKAVDKRSGQALSRIEAHRRDQIEFLVHVNTNITCAVTIQESPESELFQFNFSSPTSHVFQSIPNSNDFVRFKAKPRNTGLLVNTVIVTTADDQAEASATVRVSDPGTEIFPLTPDYQAVFGIALQGAFIGGGDPPPAIEKVEVAVLESEKGLGSFEGEDPPFKAKRCDWLTKSGKFKEVKPNDDGVCDEPVWIKAKLKGKAKDKKRDWEYEFKKPLEPGKYIAYSRATNKAGVSEPVFTKKIGNRKSFVVRERKRD